MRSDDDHRSLVLEGVPKEKSTGSSPQFILFTYMKMLYCVVESQQIIQESSPSGSGQNETKGITSVDNIPGDYLHRPSRVWSLLPSFTYTHTHTHT